MKKVLIIIALLMPLFALAQVKEYNRTILMSETAVFDMFHYDEAYALEVTMIDSHRINLVLLDHCNCFVDQYTGYTFCNENEYINTFAIEPYDDGVIYIPIIIPTHVKVEKGDLFAFEKVRVTTDPKTDPVGTLMMLLKPKVFGIK